MIRFATIGSGHIVEQFLTEAKKHPDFTLTAVYSRTAQRAAEFAARWEAPLTFTDPPLWPPAPRSMPSTSPAPTSATPSRP